MTPVLAAPTLALLGILSLVTACSGGGDEARAQREARQQARTSAQATADRLAASAGQSDDMVAAVSSAESATPVSLRFRLGDRPQVGRPLQLQLALAQAPDMEIEALHITLLPRDGLQVQSDHNLDFVSPPAGATQDLKVVLLPQQSGVLGLAVTVTVDTSKTSITRTFSVPLIAFEAAQ
jgi:hypothetical protein